MNTSEEERPNPDLLLREIQETEGRRERGRLKIFLGMSAGVGKTYGMLEAAQARKKENVDLLVGIVNTHGRQDTARLLEGLTIIPPKKIEYRNLSFEELDIDEILKRKPQLVLVDELAHTNIPGSRHEKRWQDVVELLENGIDVYTTLNVQHIESLKDIIEEITGIKVRETVPDSIIESAEFLELVDLTPAELLQRLREGKVYLGEKSELAAKHFFQEGSLTALREIVLRYAAEKVDHDLQLMSTAEPKTSWRPKERLLVGINHNPYSQKLIRATRRLATNWHAPWLALHVDDGTALDEADRMELTRNLSLARDLGAEVITTNDTEISEGIKRVIRQRRISQMVLGRPPKKFILGLFERKSLADQLIQECTDIDIYVIRQELTLKRSENRLIAAPKAISYTGYLSIFFCVISVVVINWFLFPFVDYWIIGLIFLIFIFLFSLFFSTGPLLFSACLFGLFWNLIFIPANIGLFIPPYSDEFLLTLYLLTALITGMIVGKARSQKQMLILREDSAQALYELTRLMASSLSLSELAVTLKEKLQRVLQGSFDILVRSPEGGLVLDPGKTPLIQAEKERHAAAWVMVNGKEAGWSTETLPLCQNLYIPLNGLHEVVGILIYKPVTNQRLTPDEHNMLHTIAPQLASHIERRLNDEKARQEDQHKQIEQIHTMILNRVFFNFEKPLRVTRRSIRTLKEQLGITLEIEEIEKSLEELDRMSANISALMHLSKRSIPIYKKLSSIRAIIEETCDLFKMDLSSYNLRLTIEEGLPLVNCDFYLIKKVVSYFLANAINNTPLGSTIEIQAKELTGFVAISVLNEGGEISEEQLHALFEQYHQFPTTSIPGIGLGLSTAKAIAELHEGYLKAENLPNRGTQFSLFLPLEEKRKRIHIWSKE